MSGYIFPQRETVHIPTGVDNVFNEMQVMAGGLTKRELFAAIFLHASISICNSEKMMRAVKDAATRKGQDMDDYMARESVRTADRLLAELEKPHA